MLQDALGLIDSPLPGASWHTDALTAASFFVSTRLFLTGGSCWRHRCLLLPHRQIHAMRRRVLSHMPKEAIYFGFRFRWLVGFDKHLQNTGREGREAFG